MPKMTNLYIQKRYIFIIMMLIIFIVQPVIVFAEEFPERVNQQVIIDPQQFFDQPKKSSLAEGLATHDFEYVIVIVDEINDVGHHYARDLFEHYELNDSTALFLIVMSDDELYYALGQEFVALGASRIIESRVDVTYYPNVVDGSHLTGIRSLVQSLENELEKQIAERERDAQVSVDRAAEASPVTENETTLPLWLIVLIIIFVVLLTWLIAGILYRRSVYRQVDRLEEWKVDLENRPFTQQLSRVKSLTMSGETESNFEKWKGQWESILTSALPDIEEMLIEIEDYADKYRFIKSKQMLSSTKKKLEDIEESLKKITKEIDELTNIEQVNRNKMSYLHEQSQDIHKQLQKNAMALGITYPVWHEKFKKATQWINEFHEAQNNGDYFHARDLADAVESVFGQLRSVLLECPQLVHDIENDIPQQVKDVVAAVEEMKTAGYVFEHTDVAQQIENINKLRHKVINYMQEGQIDEMKQWKETILKQIDELYDRLETEVETKQFVKKTMQRREEILEDIKEKYAALQKLCARFKQSYSWDEEWEDKLVNIHQSFEQLQMVLDKMIALEDEEIDKRYPMLKPQLDSLITNYEALTKEITEFENDIQAVRKDELAAKDEASQLKKVVVHVKSQIRKSNLPGLPDHLKAGVFLAEESITELYKHLDAIPLNISRVQHQLKDAKNQVKTIEQVCETVIEQADRAERLIQYSNRYRRMNPVVGEMIVDAEKAFRHYQYREAIELIEQALDKVEPKWRDHFEVDDEVS